MTSKAQRQIILGLETVPGDGATPDVALRAIMEFRAMPDKITPETDIGSFAPPIPYIGSLKAGGKIEMPDGYYEHAPYLISMALGAGSKTGSADPWTYTWNLPDGTPPTFATYRAEYTDGDDHVVSANDVFGTGLEITGGAGKAVAINTDIVGGSVTFPGSLGATLSPLAVPTYIRMAETGLWMDDAFGSIGTTAVAEFISFSWKLEDLQHQKQFGNSLYPTGRGNGRWKVTLEIVAEVSAAKVATEKAKLLNSSTTAIRIRSSASSNDQLTIDGPYALVELESLDDRDMNNIIKFVYQGVKDASGNVPSVVCKTNLSAL